MRHWNSALPIMASIIISLNGCTLSTQNKTSQPTSVDNPPSTNTPTTASAKPVDAPSPTVEQTKSKDKSEDTHKDIAPKKVTRKNPGDRKGHDMKEVVPQDQIPPAPILSIEEALNAFQVHEDFELQVIANEPLLFDPIMVQYDAAGRVWAVEMTTFMQDTQATGQYLKESQIVVLTDTNNDGTMDKRQVVLDRILLPRAFAFVQGGILWADNEKLHFSALKQVRDKFQVIKTDVIDPTYAKGGNIEHKTNGLLFSLDNWYYNAKSSVRYRPLPLDAKIPQNAKEIYRNSMWKMVTSVTEFRGQFGLTQDDYGRHYFNVNSTPLLTTSFIPNVNHRNPNHPLSKKRLTQKVGTTDVYPVRVNPGINRGYQEGYYREDFTLKNHTSACGPLIYRGDQFDAQYYGIGIAQEPAANLIKATKITEEEGIVSGKNLFDKQSIVASTDERFRPVNAVNAPDGTITLVDFYHGIIQERTFLTSYLVNQIKQRDLERNRHIGRLYRLKYKHNPLPKVDYLDNLTAKQLVPYLAHSNGWHRDTAQQELVMRQDKSALPYLYKMATVHSNHLAKIKALWTLEGLGELDEKTLFKASKTTINKVKISVFRLADLLPTTPQLQGWLITEAKKANKETYAALALAAGTHQAWPAITHIINQFSLDDFVIASLGHQENNYLTLEGNNIKLEARQQLEKIANIEISAPKQRKHSKQVASQIALGKTLFNGRAGCFGCHGADGEGNQFVPPLNKSEWVTGSENRLIGIMLHGLTGPVVVNNKTYDSPMTMPGLNTNSSFSDNDLAAIASYIRNEWDNEASAITEATVKNVRKQTEQQTSPYTAQTANEIK